MPKCFKPVAQDQKHVPNVGTRPVCGRRVFNIMIN